MVNEINTKPNCYVEISCHNSWMYERGFNGEKECLNLT